MKKITHINARINMTSNSCVQRVAGEGTNHRPWGYGDLAPGDGLDEGIPCWSWSTTPILDGIWPFFAALVIMSLTYAMPRTHKPTITRITAQIKAERWRSFTYIGGGGLDPVMVSPLVRQRRWWDTLPVPSHIMARRMGKERRSHRGEEKGVVG